MTQSRKGDIIIRRRGAVDMYLKKMTRDSHVNGHLAPGEGTMYKRHGSRTSYPNGKIHSEISIRERNIKILVESPA